MVDIGENLGVGSDGSAGSTELKLDLIQSEVEVEGLGVGVVMEGPFAVEKSLCASLILG